MAQDFAPKIGLLLEPLDTLFFRDGRPFEPASQASSGLPMPQTIAGALRTWLFKKVGCDFRKLADAIKDGAGFADAAAEQGEAVASVARLSFRGPWFARIRGDAFEIVVPVPATLQKAKDCDEIVRLDPLTKHKVPGWRPLEDDMQPLWRRGRNESKRIEGAYLTLNGLQAYLQGGVPESCDIVKSDELYGFDRRTGIAIDADLRTAAERMIYGVSLLALRQGVALYEEVTGPADAMNLLQEGPASIPLGGEGRRVIARKVEPVQWPSNNLDPNKERLILLTTPGLFDERWRPSFLKGKIVSAAVPGYLAVSGWDLARNGPKPTRFAVPAGSVYFLRRPIDTPRESLCDGENAAVGWGVFVEGVWNHD